MALLDIRNLTVTIRSDDGDYLLVDGIDFILEERQIHALLGESDSGKSAILQVICGAFKHQWRVTADRFRFNNQELLKLSHHERLKIIRENFSLMVQNPIDAFNPTQKIIKQLKRALIFKGKWYQYYGWKQRKILEILHKVGIVDHQKILKSYPFELTQRTLRKLMIAQALMNNPKIIIADEPKQGLDAKSSAQIDRLLKSLNQNFGASFIIASKNFASIKSLADRISVIYAGQLVESVPAGSFEAMHHPYSKTLFYSGNNFPQFLHKKLLQVLPRFTPLISRMPPGCRFAPHCPLAQQKCVEKPRKTLIRGHSFACFYPINLP